jgi:hypothetical protein
MAQHGFVEKRVAVRLDNRYRIESGAFVLVAEQSISTREFIYEMRPALFPRDDACARVQASRGIGNESNERCKYVIDRTFETGSTHLRIHVRRAGAVEFHTQEMSYCQPQFRT